MIDSYLSHPQPSFDKKMPLKSKEIALEEKYQDLITHWSCKCNLKSRKKKKRQGWRSKIDRDLCLKCKSKFYQCKGKDKKLGIIL